MLFCLLAFITFAAALFAGGWLSSTFCSASGSLRGSPCHQPAAPSPQTLGLLAACACCHSYVAPPRRRAGPRAGGCAASTSSSNHGPFSSEALAGPASTAAWCLAVRNSRSSVASRYRIGAGRQGVSRNGKIPRPLQLVS